MERTVQGHWATVRSEENPRWKPWYMALLEGVGYAALQMPRLVTCHIIDTPHCSLTIESPVKR